MVDYIHLNKSHFLMTIHGLYDPFRKSKISRISRPTKTIKEKVIEAYGGKCVCCGISDHDFLTIDHIYRDGKQDRKKYGAGANFYRLLEKWGYPKDRYRLLCMNCNWAQRDGTPCPHQGKTRLKCLDNASVYKLRRKAHPLISLRESLEKRKTPPFGGPSSKFPENETASFESTTLQPTITRPNNAVFDESV